MKNWKKIAFVALCILLAAMMICGVSAAEEGDYAEWTVTFWVAFALVGFVAPIPFLIVGFALPRSKKRGSPEYWYIVAILAGIWLLLAAVLLVILVV